MHIILKKTLHNNDEILNIFYCQDETMIRNWIKEYIQKDIEKMQIENNATFEINDAEKDFQLIKKFKQINKGYIYNSSEKIAEVVYNISMLEYLGLAEPTSLSSTSSTIKESHKWADINNEINKRVLKSLDKDTLYQIITRLESKIKTKGTWNRTEYVGMVSDTIQNYKKKLYSSIAKRMKRFGKTQKNLNGVPDDFNNLNNRGSCHLNFLKNQNEK